MQSRNWNVRYRGSRLSPIPCHVSENANDTIGLQVRSAGQAGYPISLVASSDTVPVKCCAPLPIYIEVLHLFRCFTHTHTHTRTLPKQGGIIQVRTNDMKIRMKRGWRWDENEDKMKNYLTGTRGGERKRRGREKTPTPTHLARSGQTLKEQGLQVKRKTEADGNGTRPEEEGRKEAPEPTYPSVTYAYLGMCRTQPT